MATIIKARTRNDLEPAEAVALGRSVGRADSDRGPLRDEAARIIVAARREAEEIRRRAADEGRREGEAAAREEWLRRQHQQWASVESALGSAIERLDQARGAWLGHWERTTIHLAVAIAERLLRRKLPEHPDVPLTLVREALELAAGSGDLRVRLNPADRDALGDRVEGLARQFAGLGSIEITADPAIARGGCRVDTRFGTIDQRIETQLARIEEELL
ncbi:MAG: hypothetical protein GX621_08320 [Pirellulaceae bacterium]|nr:hypothetical protein [Pirellulaceae bacterium]